ncbi:adenosine deaminase family protein [Streptoalloteichus tenebrarius]|uniref:adenosine deaminase family protein n=1 Tax=Streptoalloteichus tenebrarius (strain ATCC 17920 / DSM 40477 / JCM 4838 / CBS 697.72 / NBRC 16177 / NCIMB 11028 / NRRL B-12390 / A12253. 1 / ISP 5477) TaxID=1933 RepID=UPI0020A48B35|nr:hypothetical protein [Streptoalloteichus tenebrarius]BFF00291.1 hypothetical protein GCM10020241_19660 [Streptoalloteichus tenebrarius]
MGRRRADDEHGVELVWIFDIPGEKGPGSTPWTGCCATARRARSGSGSVAWRSAPELFREAFDRARAAGLRSLPHAGETTGPEPVWSALRERGAERIGHGITAVDDPRLLEHLAERGIALEVCPPSNVRTRAVRSLAEHPLPRLLAAGVPVTLATDDPGMSDTDLNHEYPLCHTEVGVSPAELAELSRAGVRAGFCDDATRARNVGRTLGGHDGRRPGRPPCRWTGGPSSSPNWTGTGPTSSGPGWPA